MSDLNEKVDALTTEVSEIKQTLSELKELVNISIKNQMQLFKTLEVGFTSLAFRITPPFG